MSSDLHLKRGELDINGLVSEGGKVMLNLSRCKYD